MPYLLALDQGTTSSRALVFTPDGRIVALAQQEFPQLYPQPGWVEHEPEAIWHSQLTVAQTALRQSRLAPNQIAAIGITNQRETTLVWERATGTPVCNAIVWQDRRTAPLCDRLREAGAEPLIRARTGLLLDAYFSGTKLAWLLEHSPGLRKRAECGELAFGTVDTWLAWRLTGGRLHITDPSNASRTLLFNIHEGRWDDDLLILFGIPPALLPDLRPTSAVHAEIDSNLLGHPIPLGALVGDQQAALFGQYCHRPGMLKTTYGTGAFLLQMTGERPVQSQNGLLSTVAWQMGADAPLCYALEGSIFVAGALTQWLRDGLGIIKASDEISQLAATVPDTAGVQLVPAFVGLGAPHWDPYARGTIVGLTRGTTAAHVARAAEEAIAHQVADVVEAMQSDSHLPPSEMRVDGGAAADDLLLQIQSNLLQCPIVRPQVIETTAYGAALLAGRAVGLIDPETHETHMGQPERVFTPEVSADAAGTARTRWKAALRAAQSYRVDC